MDTPIVAVDDLTVTFETDRARINAVDQVSFAVSAGDIYALVGESGCGKSTLAYSMLDIVPPPGRVSSGEVRYRGRSLASIRPDEMNRLRAADLAMVFQAAMNAFNPVITIGRQVEHILQAHRGVFDSTAAGRDHFRELLRLIRLPVDRIWGAYESQLSGGMKQRVAIAVAMLLKPKVLILDEPTTALDLLNQRLVIEILQDLHRELGVTIIFVTHDLAVVAELATRVGVMYAGHMVEEGTVDEIFAGAGRHPYVAGLIDAIPSVAGEWSAARSIPGQVPNLAELPPGCRFAPRCPLAQPYCREVEPELLSTGNGHRIACHVVNGSLATPEEVAP